MGIYWQAVYVTKEHGLSLLIRIFLKKYRKMFISQYQSRTGKEKVIANEEKGRRGPEKDAYLKTNRLLCAGAGSHHGFSQKEPKKDHVFIAFFLTPPPLSLCGLTWFYKQPPLPFNGPLGLCTAPKRNNALKTISTCDEVCVF